MHSLSYSPLVAGRGQRDNATEQHQEASFEQHFLYRLFRFRSEVSIKSF